MLIRRMRGRKQVIAPQTLDGEIPEAAEPIQAAVVQAYGYNRMLYVGLNPVVAKVHRVQVAAYQYIYAGLLSFVVIFSVWAVGVLLVTAMLIVPVAAARNFARTAGGMVWWALLVSVISAVVGLWLFSPISLLGGNFNPRNINHMPAVKFFATP